MGKKSVRGIFTQGDLNRLVDAFVHPLYRESKNFMIADAILHSAIEQNPTVSLKKLIKYDAPLLLGQVGRKSEGSSGSSPKRRKTSKRARKST